jgi:hypothetical protein
VNGAEWIQYFKGNGLIFFYDVQSINYLPQNSIRVFTEAIPEDEESRVKKITNMRKTNPTLPANWSSATDLWEINCKNRTYKILEVTNYDEKNEVISSTTFENPTFGYISPESMMEALE